MTEGTPAAPHPGEDLLRVAEEVHAGEVSVAFRSGPTVLAKVGAKLLDIAEASQVPMESGCRMGMRPPSRRSSEVSDRSSILRWCRRSYHSGCPWHRSIGTG